MNKKNKRKSAVGGGGGGDHVGIQRCFLILLIRLALPRRLQGRRSYKTKISATKAAGGCWLCRRSTLGLNYLRH